MLEEKKYQVVFIIKSMQWAPIFVEPHSLFKETSLSEGRIVLLAKKVTGPPC